MTLLNQTLQQPRNVGGEGSNLGDRWDSSQEISGSPGSTDGRNVGENERVVSIAAGAILALQGLSRRSIPGFIIAGIGGAMIYRGATGHCHAYQAMGLNTAKPESVDGQKKAGRGFHVEQAYIINKPIEELYQFWRNFENLPRVMTHLQSVRNLDDRRSHWVARAPGIVGGKVEWEAELTRDEPNRLISWRSLPGSDVDSVGQVRFEKALGDRGTEIHVFMDYVPPAGYLGNWISKLFGESAYRQLHDDLRTFKRVMEVGEEVTIVGQPRGTCFFGHGKREGM